MQIAKLITSNESNSPRFPRFLSLTMAVALVLFQLGCASTGRPPADVKPEASGPGSGFWGPGDIEAMAKKIADRMVETPRVMNSTRAQYILVAPVSNQTRYAELTRSDIFTEELITELSKRKEFSEKVFFINRERAALLEEERKKKESGSISGSSDVDYAGADYVLAGKFMDAATTSGSTTQVALRFLYVLTDARRQIEVFRDAYPLRRAGARDKSYE